MVKLVPVNYAIRLGDPREPPHRPPRPVWCWSQPHLPVRLLARYKDALVSRRFFNTSLYSFPRLLYVPEQASGLGGLY